MTKHRVLCAVAISAVATLVGTGCGSKPGAGPSGSASSAPASSASSGASDYSKPALTDEKIAKLIESMQEEKNPLEFIFRPGGQMRGFAEMKAKEIEFNAYAKKYGFKDYTEYIDTWGRVMVGEMQLAAGKMMQGLKESTEKSIQEAEARLKDPSLLAEQKQMYTSQLEDGKKSLADFTKNDANSLNAADLALVEKYKTQLDQAAKKRRGR